MRARPPASLPAMKAASENSLGALLREARVGRTVTQADLSLHLGVSQRHVSYVESGRTRPSRALLLAWLKALRAPPAMRNAALLLSGYAVHAADRLALEDSDEIEVARALLASHEPSPGIAVDAHWRLVAANPARIRLHRLVMPALPAALRDATEGVDLMDLLVRPHGLLSTLRDAHVLGWSLLGQLRAEAWAHAALRERVDTFEQRLHERHPRPASGLLRPAGQTQLRMVFDSAAGPLSFHAVQLTVGLPQNITTSSLRVTLWYPLDARTREALAAPA